MAFPGVARRRPFCAGIGRVRPGQPTLHRGGRSDGRRDAAPSARSSRSVRAGRVVLPGGRNGPHDVGAIRGECALRRVGNRFAPDGSVATPSPRPGPGLTSLLAAPAARMPMTSVLRCVERDHDFVSLAGPDLVVAARTPVGFVGLIRLHVANIDRWVVRRAVVGPVVPGHRDRAAPSAQPVTTTNAARDRLAVLRSVQGRTRGEDPTWTR
jgi:hypothetical protein